MSGAPSKAASDDIFEKRMRDGRPTEVQADDKRYLWHPFTQQELWEGEDQVVIDHAEGCYLFDAKGRRYLDGISSLWVNVHGHRRPEINAAITAQLDRVAH